MGKPDHFILTFNLIRNIIPLMISSVHMAIHTPARPRIGVRIMDNTILTPHMLTRFMILGTNVSPTPLSAPVATIEAANNGSAKSSIRRTLMPSSWTAISGVKKLNI